MIPSYFKIGDFIQTEVKFVELCHKGLTVQRPHFILMSVLLIKEVRFAIGSECTFSLQDFPTRETNNILFTLGNCKKKYLF